MRKNLPLAFALHDRLQSDSQSVEVPLWSTSVLGKWPLSPISSVSCSHSAANQKQRPSAPAAHPQEQGRLPRGAKDRQFMPCRAQFWCSGNKHCSTIGICPRGPMDREWQRAQMLYIQPHTKWKKISRGNIMILVLRTNDTFKNFMNHLEQLHTCVTWQDMRLFKQLPITE